MQLLRRTKIIATLGPATDDEKALEKLLKAGTNVVRLNFSHSEVKKHKQRAESVRACAAKLGLEIGILADLQGPKIRIACFKHGSINLTINDKFVLDAN